VGKIFTLYFRCKFFFLGGGNFLSLIFILGGKLFNFGAFFSVRGSCVMCMDKFAYLRGKFSFKGASSKYMKGHFFRRAANLSIIWG